MIRTDPRDVEAFHRDIANNATHESTFVPFLKRLDNEDVVNVIMVLHGDPHAKARDAANAFLLSRLASEMMESNRSVTKAVGQEGSRLTILTAAIGVFVSATLAWPSWPQGAKLGLLVGFGLVWWAERLSRPSASAA